MPVADYLSEKDKIKQFLADFYVDKDNQIKEFRYRKQLTKIAHREQVALTIDIDDIQLEEPELAENVVQNTRRYVSLFADAVYEMLPDYKEREPALKDALDVYIEHRLLMEQRFYSSGQQRDPRNSYPPELIRRFMDYGELESLEC